MKKIPSPNFDQRKAAIDMLVFHYTGRPSLKESLGWLSDPMKKISAHYVVAEAGEIYQLVDEKMRAWHAGKSFWKGERDINSCSIGIEIQNPGHEFGYANYPEKQIAALIELSKDILKRHAIPPGRVLGHSDVAPRRKQDPGEKFPWRELADEGIGRWPEKPRTQEELKDRDLKKTFLQLGYDPKAGLAEIVTAFQRHWRPEKVSGQADRETVTRLLGLL